MKEKKGKLDNKVVIIPVVSPSLTGRQNKCQKLEEEGQQGEKVSERRRKADQHDEA